MPGEERGNETEKVVIAHGGVEFCEATPIGLADESKNPYTDASLTEVCVAPRHVDASRDFLFIFIRTSSARARGGGGVQQTTRAGLATV